MSTPKQNQSKTSTTKNQNRRRNEGEQPLKQSVAEKQVVANPAGPSAAKAKPFVNPLQFDVPDMADVLNAFPEIKAIRPECAALPVIDKEDFNRLAHSIQKIGIQHAVQINDKGELLDGRGRLAVAFLLGIEPPIEKTDQDAVEIAWMNLARRHLTVGQKSVTATDLLVIESDLAAERKLTNLKKGNEIPECDNCLTRETETGRASEIAGRKVGVSGKSVERAAKLSPELKEKVRTGELTLNAAVNQDKKRQAAFATPDETETDAEESQTHAPLIKTLYGSEGAIVYGNSQTPVHVFVYRVATDKWRVIRTDSVKSSIRESKDKAFLTALSIFYRLVNPGDA